MAQCEDAFNTVKRLLDLSYLWTGSINGIKLQIWGTWLFYSILVDMGDAVAVSLLAVELSLPIEFNFFRNDLSGYVLFLFGSSKRISKRPFFMYFAAPENKDLGIVKLQKRKHNTKLIVAPFPEKSKGSNTFFYSSRNTNLP